MSCSLSCNFKTFTHIRSHKRTSYRVDAQYSFQPSAGSSIPTIINIQMLSITVHPITDKCGTGILNSRSHRYKNIKTIISDTLSRCINYGMIHGKLILVVISKTRKSTVGCISPCLMPYQLHIFRCQISDIADKVTKIWSIGFIQTRQRTSLL